MSYDSVMNPETFNVSVKFKSIMTLPDSFFSSKDKIIVEKQKKDSDLSLRINFGR